MSQVLIQGNFVAKATKVALSKNKKGQDELRVEFEIVGGEHNGRRLPYSGLFGEKAIKYTKSAMRELGWNGKPLPTEPKEAASTELSKQIMTAAKKAVPIEVTVASWNNPDTGELREWSTVRNVGAYQAPVIPLDKSDVVNINRWLAEVPDDGKNDDSIPF